MAAARSLAQFQKAFSDEAKCVAFMFKRRWPDGFVCPACGKRRFATLKSRPRLYECLDCGRQTSVTAGTAMHRSRLPLTTWFWAAHLMTTHSNGMSALQLQDQLWRHLQDRVGGCDAKAGLAVAAPTCRWNGSSEMGHQSNIQSRSIGRTGGDRSLSAAIKAFI